MLTNLIKNALARLQKAGDAMAAWGIGPALARLTVGVVFVGSGWGKLHSLPDITAYFTELHIPAPAFNARLVGCTELVGGILMLLGLGTRLVALPMAFTMVIAIATARRDKIEGLTSLLGFEEWSYLVFFLWLALSGAGRLSLDALIQARSARASSRR